jgi:hypothetical protein
MVTIYGSSPDTATADADGYYEITGLKPGSYAVFASAGELRATHLRQAFGDSRPYDAFTTASFPVVRLKSGEFRSNVDFALARALAIEGRVLDPNDEPMANVAVDVARWDGLEGNSTRLVLTDDLGRYRLFNLAPDRYRVCAAPQGAEITAAPVRARLVRTCHLASTRFSEAADVVVGPSDAVGIDIRIQTSVAFSVSGTAVDAAGAPLDNAPISATSDDHSISVQALAHHGLFQLRGLLPGQYLVTASVGELEVGGMPLSKREPERAEVFVDVSADDVTNLALNTQPAWHLPGRMVFEGGTPPSGMRMFAELSTLTDEWVGPSERPARVNANLTFELKGLSHRPLAVSIVGLPDGWLVKSILCDGREVRGRSLDVARLTSDSRLTVVVTNHVAHPSIRVVDEQSRPATNYLPLVIPAGLRPARLLLSRLRDVSEDGVYELDGFLPGEYLVGALSPEDSALLSVRPDPMNELAPLVQRVTLREGRGQVVNVKLLALPLR